MIQVPNALVDVDWLQNHLNSSNLILLEATIPKVGIANTNLNSEYIPNSLFFDIKKVFSNTNAAYPNTVLEASEFEEKARLLGINNDSCIVVYDQYGIYSAARVWWLFHLMGHQNVAVLNGGLPKWKSSGYRTEKEFINPKIKGNFKAVHSKELFASKEEVFQEIENEETLTVDARSKSRFFAEVPEPREGLRSGHIPSSINIPYTLLLENGSLKSKEELSEIFNITFDKKKLYFSCGSGITACILALGYHLTVKNNFAVYDGSWTEWGSEHNLPIETV